MFGSHLSISGGLHNALLKAEDLGFATVQIFTKNQQQWRVPPLEQEQIRLWKENATRLKFKKTVSHASYLINLASPEDALWRKSVDLFVEELSRCAALDIPYLVIHPGAHMGGGEESGLGRVAKALDQAYGPIEADGVVTCLEITAGQGTCLGHRLEQLAAIIKQARCVKRLGICLDTAHLFAAGYDFRGRKYSPFIREVDRIVGLKRVKVLHLNDSKKDLGSRVDRHDHIGQGKIGLAGFRPFVRDKAFASIPKILETPKEKAPDGRDWDQVNVETLRRLM
jgi:deoxyribonuclease-4